MHDFSVNSETLSGNGRMLVCVGSLDFHSFEELDDALMEAMDEGIEKIVVDMRKVDYVSSAGPSGAPRRPTP